MANYKVVDADELDAKFSAIGDSVRAKTGKTELIPIDDIPAEIDSISGGGGDPRVKQLIEGTLEELNDENITYIQEKALWYNSSITSVSLPNATTVGSNGIAYLGALKRVDLPNVTAIKDNAFYNSASLSEIYLPNLKKAGFRAFGSTGIRNIILPQLDTIGSNTVDSCQNLFSQCKKLEYAVLSKIPNLPSQAFTYCSNLIYVDTSLAAYIPSNAFTSCENLKYLILRITGQICRLNNVSAVSKTPFAEDGTGGICLVPSALITEYQTATNWSTLYTAGTCLFWALEDYTVDGTIEGEIDWDKLNTDREGAFAS